MDGVEIAEFLLPRATGVLALATDDQAYAIPMSYAYSPDDPAFYFRLGYGADSEKRDYLLENSRATFVVYDETPAGWASVVAEGPVETVAVGDADAAVEEAVRGLDIPYFDVHGEPSEDLEFDTGRLRPRKLTGIREGD